MQQIDFLKFAQIITDIKTKMRVHSGITRDFRKKLIDGYILRKKIKERANFRLLRGAIEGLSSHLKSPFYPTFCLLAKK